MEGDNRTPEGGKRHFLAEGAEKTLGRFFVPFMPSRGIMHLSKEYRPQASEECVVLLYYRGLCAGERGGWWGAVDSRIIWHNYTHVRSNDTLFSSLFVSHYSVFTRVCTQTSLHHKQPEKGGFLSKNR